MSTLRLTGLRKSFAGRTVLAGVDLDVPAGEQHIDGVTALAFWRTREDLGEGSDLQRIQRDQFMSAQIVQGLMKSGLLSDPSRLLKVLSAAASSLTTDSSMSLPKLASLGESLRSVPSRDVQFFTAPTVPDPANPNEVDFAQPQADELFSEIARDASASAPSPASSAPVPAGELPPAQVKVQVLNGSGMAGVAAVAAGELSSRGFDVTGTGDATSFGNPASVVEYGAASDLPAARTVAAQVPGSVLKLDPTLGAGAVDLVLGSNFTQLAPEASGPPASASPSATPSAQSSAGESLSVPAASPSASPSPAVTGTGSASPSGTASPSGSPSPSPSATGVGSIAQANGGISADAACSTDSQAFAGPNSPPIPSPTPTATASPAATASTGP